MKGLVAMSAVLGSSSLLLAGSTADPPGSREPSARVAQIPPGRLSLTEEGRAAANIDVFETTRRTLPELIHTTGTVEIDADRVAHLGARLPGFALEVTEKGRLGQQVVEGDALVVVQSLEFGKAQIEYRKALQMLDLRQRTFDRERDLFDRKISSGSDFVEAESNLAQARIDLEAAANGLEVAGVDADELAAIAAGGARLGCIRVRAPIAGTIIEKHVVRGEHVDTETDLFTIADVEHFWLFADIYERDLARIAKEQRAEVRIAAWPDEVFAGRITYVSDVMDVETRTLKVRIELKNRDGKLKSGMFAAASIAVGSRPDVVAVPLACIQSRRQQAIVFVETARNVFDRRLVRTGVRFDGDVEIVEGVQPGEKVVRSGAFLLQSELEKEDFESD